VLAVRCIPLDHSEDWIMSLKWKSIDSAPNRKTPMFLIKGVDVGIHDNYTTDPYCSWIRDDGSFARWPHAFKPTHWCEIPSGYEDEPELDEVY